MTLMFSRTRRTVQEPGARLRHRLRRPPRSCGTASRGHCTLIPLTVALALLLACGGDEVRSPPPSSGDGTIGDVLLITIDTARHDRFSYTGDSPVATPAVDAVAADGVAFLGAVSPAPLTLPAHASLFTGKIPPRHGVRSNGIYRLVDQHTTLAELLRSAGFRSAAFVGASVLAKRYGLDQGFHLYDDRVDPKDAPRRISVAQRRAEAVVTSAITWLDQNRDSRTFVWVHLYDPHAPYDPPEPERTRFKRRPYDGEIAYSDRMIGRLLDGYTELGRRTRALVVITSDHGESLGQHGEATHGMFVFDATARVPLLFQAPGLVRGTTVREQVSLVDVMPTVLELLDIAAPPDLDGVSLAAQLVGGERAHEDRLIYLETLSPRLHHGWAESRALRSSRFKLIEGARVELFDLESDPDELVDIADREPHLTSVWRHQLEQRSRSGSQHTGATLAVDAETRRKLASLGYITASAGESRAAKSGLPDPRDRMHLLHRMNKALRHWSHDRRASAIALAREVVSAEPGSAYFVRQLANMYLSEERMNDASRLYRRAIELAPTDIDSWTKLGAALHALGRNDQALAALDTALQLDPTDRASRHCRWNVMLARGDRFRVASEASIALQRDPADGEAQWAYLEAGPEGDPTERSAALELALVNAPGDPTLALELGKLLEERGELARAEQLYRIAYTDVLAADEATFHLARLLFLSARHLEAAAIVRGATHVRRTPELLYLLSEIRYQIGDPEGAVAALEKVVRRAPQRADVWATLATVRLAQGNELRARSAYRRVLELGSDDPILRARLGTVADRLPPTDPRERLHGAGHQRTTRSARRGATSTP